MPSPEAGSVGGTPRSWRPRWPTACLCGRSIGCSPTQRVDSTAGSKLRNDHGWYKPTCVSGRRGPASLLRAPVSIAAITGWGAVSAAGRGSEALYALIASGKTAVRPAPRLNDAHAIAALVPGSDEPPMTRHADGRSGMLWLAWARDAATEALNAAGPRGACRFALVVGTGVEDRPVPQHELIRRLGDALGVDGPRIGVSVACASGTAAAQLVLDLLRTGAADRVLYGAVDVLTPRVWHGFRVLGALADGPSTPFGPNFGMSVGEGAAFLVVDALDDVEDHVPCLLGAASVADGFHATRPSPDGRGVTNAIQLALHHANLPASQVDHVNAHGTGTEANDAAEVRGIRTALGHEPPISSVKGAIGHAQGAAGGLELIASLAARNRGEIPPTAGWTSGRPGAPIDPVAGTARRGPCRTLLSLNAAFGGVVSAVVIGPPAAWCRETRPVSWAASCGHEAPWPRHLDPARLDTVSAALIRAISGALDLAGISLDRHKSERIGLVVGMPALAASSRESIETEVAHELAGLTGRTFAAALPVAAPGAASRALGLTGPLEVVLAGRAAGLLAVATAGRRLAEMPHLLAVVGAWVAEPVLGSLDAAAVVLLPGGHHRLDTRIGPSLGVNQGTDLRDLRDGVELVADETGVARIHCRVM